MEIEIELLKIGRIAAKENTRYAISCTRIVQKKQACSILSINETSLLLAEWTVKKTTGKQPNIDALIPSHYLDDVLRHRTAAERRNPGRHQLITQFDGQAFKLKGDRQITAIPHTEETCPFPNIDCIIKDARGKINNLYFGPPVLMKLIQVMVELLHDVYQPVLRFTVGKGKSSPIIIYGETQTRVKLTGVLSPCSGPSEKGNPV